MYLNYWQLQTRPFENAWNSVFYYPTQLHQSAFVRLRYTLEDRAGSAVLAGVSGTGKSLLIHQLKQVDSIRQNLDPFIHLVFPQFGVEDMLSFCAAALCSQLKKSLHAGEMPAIPGAGGTPAVLWEMESLLKENCHNGKRAVLVVDDADAISDPNVLRVFKSLLAIETEGKPCLSVVFLGEGEIFHTLTTLPSLEQLIEAKCTLEPFSEWETDQYINHRLAAAGCHHELFDQDTTSLIYEFTQGIPRQINRLCDLALLVGYVQKSDRVELHSIETLFEELVAV